MDEIKDDQLIKQTLDGCKNSFNVLVERYQDKLRSYTFRITRSESEAEDVLQEAFILAYTHLASFRGEGKFCTWLYAIVRNLAISNVRKRKSHLTLSEGIDFAGGDPPPDEGIRVSELSDMVNQGIAELDESYRQIVILREIEGKEYQEISELLDIPLGTVKSRLHKARTLLKEKLENRL